MVSIGEEKSKERINKMTVLFPQNKECMERFLKTFDDSYFNYELAGNEIKEKVKTIFNYYSLPLFFSIIDNEFLGKVYVELIKFRWDYVYQPRLSIYEIQRRIIGKIEIILSEIDKSNIIGLENESLLLFIRDKIQKLLNFQKHIEKCPKFPKELQQYEFAYPINFITGFIIEKEKEKKERRNKFYGSEK